MEFLRAHPGGNLFNDMSYGSYVIWAAPEQRIFVDPRVELYPRSLVLDYLRIVGGQDAAALLAAHGADRVLLSRRYEQRLSAALATSSGWRQEYVDGESEIWRYEPAS